MIKIGFNLKGMRAALARAPSEVAARVDKALDKNADELVSTAKQFAEASKLTGALQESIVKTKVEGGYVVEATDEAAGPVEWGTTKMTAQPFFYPAYRVNKKRGRGRVARAIKAGLKDAGLDGKK